MLALGFAAAFGVNAVLSRRGVLRANASYVANVSILSGPVFFLVVCLAIGEVFRFGQAPLMSYVFFALSGIIHFACGRTFGYKSLELIGVTRSNIVTGLSTIVSIILAVVFLKEILTPIMVFGILISLLGPLLMAWKDETIAGSARTGAKPRGVEVDRHTLYLGLLYGAGAAIFWGSSPLFVKLGIDSGGSSIAGNLAAYTAASLVILPTFLSVRARTELLTADRQSLQLALMSGMSTNIAQMLRFLALAYTSVTVVSMAQRTIPIWSLLLVYIFNRKLESFGPWVLAGNALLMIGTVLVFAEQFWAL